MAWRSVAEAAAAMGVSERTIWRRIKSDTIESRSENGRTLVQFEEPDPNADPVRQLSHVAVAQLSMRKLDAETMADVMTVLTDYRSSFDREIARARRSARSGMVLAVVLLVAVTGGVVYHLQYLRGLKERQQAAFGEMTAGLEAKHQKDLTDLKTSAAEAEARAAARGEDLEKFRQDQQKAFAELSTQATARDALHATTNDRLAELNKTLSASETRTVETAAESNRLRDEIASLQTRVGEKTLAVEQHQRQADRVTEALRRSAARSNGMATGLRIYVARQDEQIRRLQAELEEARKSAAGAKDGQSAAPQSHQELLRAIAEVQSERPPQAPPQVVNLEKPKQTWPGLFKDLLSDWLGFSESPEAPGNLASAE